jgi:pSer/pThr/pTyr-binding forkhead associated (FHA) protein
MAAEPSSTTNANAAALRPLGSHARSPAMPLSRPLTLVGSDPRCHLHLVSSTVSRQHVVIVSGDGVTYVRDLVSRTHVLVNQEAVREAELKNGDELQIGKFAFSYIASPNPPTEVAPAAAALNISTRPEALNITGHTVLIGRDPGCDVAIEDDAISARHAIVFDIGGKRYVRDLNSRTGTFLNGSRVRQQEVLFGDQIRVGETRLEVIAAKPAAAKAAKPVAPAVVADAAPPKAEAAARMVVPPMVAALEPAAAVAASRVEPPAIEIKPAAAVAPAAPARAAVSPFAKGRPGAPAPLAAGPDEEIAPPPKPVRPAAPPVVMVFQPLVPAPELPRLMVLPPIPKPAPTAITTGAVPPPAAAVAPKGVERAPVKSEPVAGIAPAAELPRPAMAKPVAQPVVSRVEPPVVKVIEPPAPVAKVEMPGKFRWIWSRLKRLPPRRHECRIKRCCRQLRWLRRLRKLRWIWSRWKRLPRRRRECRLRQRCRRLRKWRR